MKDKFIEDKLEEWSKPKPITLGECFDAIDRLEISDEERKSWLAMDEDEATSGAHHGFGTWIRNMWNLWDPECPLHQHMRLYGIVHADDMSSIIITSYHRSRNNKPVMLIEQLETYWEHWTEYNKEYLPDHIKETEKMYLDAFKEWQLKTKTK